MGQIFAKTIYRIFDTDVELYGSKDYLKQKSTEIVNALLEKNNDIKIHMNNVRILEQFVMDNEYHNIKRIQIMCWLLTIDNILIDKYISNVMNINNLPDEKARVLLCNTVANINSM